MKNVYRYKKADERGLRIYSLGLSRATSVNLSIQGSCMWTTLEVEMEKRVVSIILRKSLTACSGWEQDPYCHLLCFVAEVQRSPK